MSNNSKGSSTFLGLKKYIIERSKTRVYAFLHIAAHGLAAAGCASEGVGGENDCLNQVDVARCVAGIRKYPEDLVGVKVRITANITNQGRVEKEVYRRAKLAAREVNLPLMVHHSWSTIPTQREKGQAMDEPASPGDLSSGDIYTHTYHAHPESIINPNTKQVYPDVIDAQKRGVLFDIGHGQGSFSWQVAEIASGQGFWPDIIGTDLHSGNMNSPAYDLPTVMSKLLHVGMPLTEIIKATTVTPAKAIGRSSLIGTLGIGREADITILKLEHYGVELEDCHGQVRVPEQIICPVGVWRAGVSHPISKPSCIPNKQAWKSLTADRESLVVKDEQTPLCLQ